MTSTTTTQQCEYDATCGLRANHMGGCRPINKAVLSPRHPAISELLLWLPEFVIAGTFFLGALVASGWLSLAFLGISLVVAAWIVGNRAVIRRRNERVLREYDQNTALVTADTKLLENRSDR